MIEYVSSIQEKKLITKVRELQDLFDKQNRLNDKTLKLVTKLVYEKQLLLRVARAVDTCKEHLPAHTDECYELPLVKGENGAYDCRCMVAAMRKELEAVKDLLEVRE
jgi:hypothetical protein